MELKIVQFLNHFGRGTVVDSFTFYLSWLPLFASFWFLIVLAALIFDYQNGRKIFLGAIFIVIIYFVLNDLIIKQSLASIFFRDRPYLAHPNLIISSGEVWNDSSFYSGHMTMTLSFLTFLLYFYRRRWTWILAILFVFFMAFARMHNGMHYPSDVLAGIIFGTAYGLLAVFLVKKIRPKLAK